MIKHRLIMKGRTRGGKSMKFKCSNCEKTFVFKNKFLRQILLDGKFYIGKGMLNRVSLPKCIPLFPIEDKTTGLAINYDFRL